MRSLIKSAVLVPMMLLLMTANVQASVPAPPVEPTVIYGSVERCGDEAFNVVGCYDETANVIYLLKNNAVDYQHERGHAFDLQTMTDEERLIFLTVIHKSKLSWWSDTWGWQGAEWFADIYSLCVRVRRIDPTWGYSAGSGLVGGKRLARACRYISTL